MAGIVYGLCALTAAACAYLLLRAYFRLQYKLLLWSGTCFVVLALNNVLLVVDKLAIPLIDLSVLRNFITLAALAILIYGLVWDAE